MPTETEGQPSPSPRPRLEISATATLGDIPTQLGATWTPAPTKSPDEARGLVADLLANNTGCRLPCWWGSTPGRTSWGTAESFLSPFSSIHIRGDFPQEFEADVFVLALKSQEIYPWHYYAVQDMVIESIKIDDTGGAAAHQFTEFFKTYGPPSEVWIRTYREGVREVPPPFETALFYPDQGIVAAFDVEGEVQGNTVRGCPQHGRRPSLGLWSPELQVTFHEAADMFRWDREEWAFLPLAEATGMDVEAFYEAFSEPNNTSCLETRADLWTPQY